MRGDPRAPPFIGTIAATQEWTRRRGAENPTQRIAILRSVTTNAPSLASNGPSFLLRYLVKRARFANPLLSGRPAVTYASYRTGSTAIHHAIRSAGIGVSVKAHMLAFGNMVERVRDRQRFANADTQIPKSCHVGDWSVRLGIVEPRREADFVILVRDPWAVAHSIFVLSGPRTHPEFAAAPRDAHERARMVDRAEEIIFGAFPREIMCRWVREDVHTALGWNPLAQPFDAERGVCEYEHGPWRIQLMRSDIPDERKSEALRAFFKRPSIVVERKNDALSKTPISATVSEIAREAIARRPDAVAAMYGDAVCTHFWTARERDAMRARWTEPATVA